MRRRPRLDLTHAEVVAALRAIGCSVQGLAGVGEGCPDLLIGYRGVNVLLEMKSEGGAATEPERLWHERWRGQVGTAANVDYALHIVSDAAVRLIERRKPWEPPNG